MITPPHKPRPGDLILNRYMLNATEQQRQDARENLKQLAHVLMRIETRLAQEWHEKRTREFGADAVDSEGTSPMHL